MNKIRRRIIKPNKFYHVWNRGNRKQNIFKFPVDNKRFMNKTLSLASKCSIFVAELCLMDNHYHILLKQEGKVTISKMIHRLMTSYSMYFNKKYKLVGHLFQGKFNSRLIKDDRDLQVIIQYISNNPVEAGYVSDPLRYKWFYIDKDYKKRLSRKKNLPDLLKID